MNDEFMDALSAIEHDKGIKKEVLIEAIETALITAYKKHFGNNENARVEIDPETGEVHVYAIKQIVNEIGEDGSEITVEEARKINGAYEAGDTLEEEVTPADFGRIAAQTAKQVVVQKIREAERGIIYEQFAEQESEVLTAIVHRLERGNVYVEVGRAEGIIPAGETVPGEYYNINGRLKVYVLEVKKTNKGPQIIVSRTHPSLIKKLFEFEVPEIKQKTVVIKSIAREAGARTKIAVWSDDKDIDPVGSCVGHRGTRIEKVVEELNGEKIDVVPWSPDPIEFIKNSLRPAAVLMVQINEDEKAAKVIVPDHQLSLAIGKEGQNVRLAAKLTGWKIDIKSKTQSEEEAFGEEFANAEVDLENSLENELHIIDDIHSEENEEDLEEELIADEFADDDISFDDLTQEDLEIDLTTDDIFESDEKEPQIF